VPPFLVAQGSDVGVVTVFRRQSAIGGRYTRDRFLIIRPHGTSGDEDRAAEDRRAEDCDDDDRDRLEHLSCPRQERLPAAMSLAGAPCPRPTTSQRRRKQPERK